MSTLLLLRHGQASFSVGDYDRLSPLGERQARATGAYLAASGEKFDRVICGPRQRHVATAALVLEALAPGIAAESNAALDEFADGNRVLHAAKERHVRQFGEVMPQDRTLQLSWYVDTIKRWARGEAVIEGSFGAAEFFARIRDWFDDLRRQTPGSQRILAVSSAGTIAMLVCIALELPVARSAELMLAQGNASMSEIAFSGERAGLRSFNNGAHLSPDLRSRI